MSPYEPRHKIGDFVVCKYHFYDFYNYIYDDDDYYFMHYYGIIVDMAWETNWDDLETVYKVYCLDGEFRFFLEDEIEYV